LIILFALAAPLVISALLTFSWRRRKPAVAEVRAYRRCCDKLKAQGLERSAGETPGDFARRVALTKPELAEWINAVTEQFTAASYRPVGGVEHSEAVQSLRKLARQNPLNRRPRKPA
ncbi:DUF4129 domain-containing protein, partial [Litorivivens sp.]|uniref:DUF4129 domain-containing protein n=1 Tax=Litorivivens sp. TaxID=2020868 RepID=UPI0035689102